MVLENYGKLGSWIPDSRFENEALRRSRILHPGFIGHVKKKQIMGYNWWLVVPPFSCPQPFEKDLGPVPEKARSGPWKCPQLLGKNWKIPMGMRGSRDQGIPTRPVFASWKASGLCPSNWLYMIRWDSPRAPEVVSHHGEWREGTMVMYGDDNWGYLHHARGIRNVKRPHSKVLRDGCSITPGW